MMKAWKSPIHPGFLGNLGRVISMLTFRDQNVQHGATAWRLQRCPGRCRISRQARLPTPASIHFRETDVPARAISRKREPARTLIKLP
jgi:hypothetical protein